MNKNYIVLWVFKCKKLGYYYCVEHLVDSYFFYKDFWLTLKSVSNSDSVLPKFANYR